VAAAAAAAAAPIEPASHPQNRHPHRTIT